ncbi:MAG: response regulator [Acidobacteriota bacterium]
MPTILVVDDEPIDREAARRYLLPLDELEVIEAADGIEALGLISAQEPDLVLTDLRMPGMNGLELVAKMQSDFPLTPVILMTSRGNEQIAVRALKVGAASYVPKRDLRHGLLETVEQVLEVAESGHSRRKILRFFCGSETRFELENDPSLVVPIARYFQDGLERLGFGNEAIRTQVSMAIVEALTNAMIHGNLEVDSRLRRTDRAAYTRQIEERRQQDPYTGRRVHLAARASIEEVEYTIADDGPGFHPSAIPDPTDEENLLSASGRGIMLIRTFMDSVEYNDKGNQVVMSKCDNLEPLKRPR